MTKSRNAFYPDKYNAPFPTRFRELCNTSEDVKALADELGCSTQAINQYKIGTAYPKVENLIKIAHFYDCSLDYLIQLSDIRSPDASAQGSCKYTGLSERAVDILHNISEATTSEEKRTLSFLNTVLSDPECDPENNLFYHLDQYINAGTVKRVIPDNEGLPKTLEEYNRQEELHSFEERIVPVESSNYMIENLSVSKLYKAYKWNEITDDIKKIVVKKEEKKHGHEA